MDKNLAFDRTDATIIRGSRSDIEGMNVTGIYEVKCFGPDGLLKWEDTAHNVVTDVGAQLLLNQLFTTGGATANSAFFLGLINTTPTVAVTNTMSSHGSWTELTTNWSGTTRPTLTWSAATGSGAGSRVKAISTASYSITGSLTVGGCFVVTGSGAVSTVGSTAGTLYSAAAFSGGDKVVANLDTLQVSYSTAV
jgi:hypothetical protein